MYDSYFKSFTSIFLNCGVNAKQIRCKALDLIFQTILVRQYGVNCDKVIIIIYSYSK